MNRSSHQPLRSYSNSTPPAVGAPSHHYNNHFPTSATLGLPSGVNGSVYSESPGQVSHAADLNASTATTDTAGGYVTGSSTATTNVFEGEIPVYTKQMNREEVCQPLGICVSLGRGGASGVSKCINIRVTVTGPAAPMR